MKKEVVGWQWHQLDHMQTIWTSLQTDNHASTPPLTFFTGRVLFMTPNQQCQSTEGNEPTKLENARKILAWHSSAAP